MTEKITEKMNNISKKIYDPTRENSSNLLRVSGIICLITILAMIFIYKVLGGNCDLSGATNKCENGGALMYTLLMFLLFSPTLVLITWVILIIGEYIGKL